MAPRARDVVTNVIVAALALSDVLRLPGEMETMLVATAALQLVVPAPMFYAWLTGRVPKPLLGARARRIAGRAVIVGLGCAALIAFGLQQGSIHYE
jgi:hypothetical protein